MSAPSKSKKDEEMKDSENKPTEEKTNDKEVVVEEEKNNKKKKKPSIDLAAQRLERLLSSSSTSSSNPSKIVRRWLGTSSGTAAKATLAEIQAASIRLLDPEGVSALGLEILSKLPIDKVEVDDTEMKVDDEKEKEVVADDDDEKASFLSAATREVEAWLLSLAVRILWRNKNSVDAIALAKSGLKIMEHHIESSMVAVGGRDPSALFPLLARMYRLYALAVETAQSTTTTAAATVEESAYLRDDMVKAHSLACLRRDVDSQATLLNLIFRDLLSHDQVEQAHKLLSNSTFPETASHNQLCRYLYHSGLIHALRLNYTASHSALSQSLRKSQSNTGLGFRIATQRLLIVVQLLMGEIPDRQVFFEKKEMRKELEPYLKITQAVRRGDLSVFHLTVSQHASRLKVDGTYTLISRLAHSVVKAGLRKLNVSYSRISLLDIANRLSLPSPQNAEYVVAKAIRDGVIDATIFHEEGYVQSHENIDIYATKEPAETFHRRIAYCLTTHNDAIKGMKYPPDQYRKELEKSRGRGKDKSDKTDEEMAKELEEEMEDY